MGHCAFTTSIMPALPVEGSVYAIVNSSNNLGASVTINGGKTVCGKPIPTPGYYQKWMVTYTDEDNLVCSITEAEHKDSAGVIVTQPGRPVIPMHLKQVWTLKPLPRGFVGIGKPSASGNFEYVWDLPDDTHCTDRPIIINAPTLSDSQAWHFQLI
ncbi:hypothetical protein M405DRAFT_930068 [Rhizopogon salebrosus TDB-379]|nr:hypothetical protein M405DRAFT_930068 [Rhizopogon salebrosus TDB-379]